MGDSVLIGGAITLSGKWYCEGLSGERRGKLPSFKSQIQNLRHNPDYDKGEREGERLRPEGVRLSAEDRGEKLRLHPKRLSTRKDRLSGLIFNRIVKCSQAEIY
jgi:hypothetical protein